MPTLKEMAIKTAVEMGYPEDTGEHNRYVNRYLQGAKAALEMGAECFNGATVWNATQIKHTLTHLIPES